MKYKLTAFYFTSCIVLGVLILGSPEKAKAAFAIDRENNDFASNTSTTLGLNKTLTISGTVAPNDRSDLYAVQIFEDARINLFLQADNVFPRARFWKDVNQNKKLDAGIDQPLFTVSTRSPSSRPLLKGNYLVQVTQRKAVRDKTGYHLSVDVFK